MECVRWGEEDWNTLLYTLQQEKCILMLGPDASAESIDGQWKPLTEQLANELFDALDPELQQNLDPNNLAQVSQFYYIQKKRSALHAKVHFFYQGKEQIDNELYTNLAALPFYLTITSTPDTNFFEAFKDANKDPVADRYNFRGENRTMVHEGSVEQPLVYHLYGIINEPESLILTEIDLIDFLTAVIAKNPPLPNNILSQLRDSGKSLLFLGFGFKHWYLRILLHVLYGRDRESSSFALEQCVPHSLSEFQQAILFFSKSRYNIQICEKELADFVKELRQRYEKIGTTRSISTPIQSGPTVFICHASENAAQAEHLYESLKTSGFRPWGGLTKQQVSDENLERAIREEIDYVVVLQSYAMLQQCEDSFHGEQGGQQEFEKTNMLNFRQKRKLIQQNLNIGGYTIVAKECVGLIEYALRHLFSLHLTRLAENDRLAVQKAELEIGKGSKGLESFTMGQLVGVFRKSHFLDAWARTSGKDLSGLRVINLDELTNLRNSFIHGDREATRAEAEFLINCLQVIIEIFELESQETVSSEPDTETELPQQYSCKKILHVALERQNSFRPGIRFIISTQIEDCPLLEELEHLQTIDLSNQENIGQLISTIKRDQQRRKRR